MSRTGRCSLAGPSARLTSTDPTDWSDGSDRSDYSENLSVLDWVFCCDFTGGVRSVKRALVIALILLPIFSPAQERPKPEQEYQHPH